MLDRLCYCDSNTKLLTSHNCDFSCTDDGALFGVCHTFTTPNYEGDYCMCNYDCSLPHNHCEDRVYTNCTCSAADPCGLQNDGTCNEFCEIEYPHDFFDDSLDCSGV